MVRKSGKNFLELHLFVYTQLHFWILFSAFCNLPTTSSLLVLLPMKYRREKPEVWHSDAIVGAIKLGMVLRRIHHRLQADGRVRIANGKIVFVEEYVDVGHRRKLRTLYSDVGTERK
jgi:hypothetical protein